jgi:hypothetical protein
LNFLSDKVIMLERAVSLNAAAEIPIQSTFFYLLFCPLTRVKSN